MGSKYGSVSVTLNTDSKSVSDTHGNVKSNMPASATVSIKPDKELEKQIEAAALAAGFTAVEFVTKQSTSTVDTARGGKVKTTTKKRIAYFHKAK